MSYMIAECSHSSNTYSRLLIKTATRTDTNEAVIGLLDEPEVPGSDERSFGELAGNSSSGNENVEGATSQPLVDD